MSILYVRDKDGQFTQIPIFAAPDSGGNVELDTTLTQSGKAADAKAVGDKIAEITGISLVEPAEDDIPKVYFTGDLPTSKEQEEVRLTMRYISKTADFAYPVTLKVQGSSSVNYPKKNFTLKPYKDSTYESKKKLVFKNWPEMNKFVLKAHWIDHSHVRNVGTAKIWGKIMESRSDYDSLPEELRNSPNNGATDGFTVKVFANGVYQGLYEWIVPKDKLFGQDKDISTHSILNSELNNQPTCAFATTSPSMGGNWSEELQDSMSGDISTSFANFIKFVAGSTDEEFVANAESYFDVQSVIDFDIFARVFCIVDNLCRNQIFFTYDGVKWYEGCWDVDAVLGLPPTTRGFFAYNTPFQTGYIAYRDHGVTNLLYQRVETLFMERFKARYAELRSGVLSIENILEVYERMTDVITTYDGLLAEDYASTTGGGEFTGIPYKTENNIQQIRNFVAQRIPYMDSDIESMTGRVACTGISISTTELSLNGNEEKVLTVTVTPENCTDSVVWESDDTNIAIVANGVVTPVANGNAVITVTCGGYSTFCNVSVSGISGNIYTIANTLTNVSTSNTSASIEEGEPFSTTLTVDDGYVLDSVSVYMGGVDITQTVYANGAITITNVTGDITITATAKASNVANGWDSAVWATGFYNDNGKMEQWGAIHHSNLIPSSSLHNAMFRVDESIAEPYLRISYFDENEAYLGYDRGLGFNNGGRPTANNITINSANGYYISVSANTADKSKVTIADVNVTNALYRTSTSNTASTVPFGGSYTAVLSADSGCELTNAVSVSMGGEDITDTAYSDGVVSISNVTGDIYVTAVGLDSNGVIFDGANHGETEGKWTSTDNSKTATIVGGTWDGDILNLDGTDDYVEVPLTNAKSAIIVLKRTRTTDKPYIFDCRTTKSAYMYCNTAADYIGNDVTVWANDTLLKRAIGGFDDVPISEMCVYTLVFNTPFTGNMYVGCRYSKNEGFLAAEVATIRAYDTDISPSA